MTLCFRAWTLRGGHSLHRSILCVRQHLGRAPWDTLSIINKPRKTLHSPTPQQAGFSSALNVTLRWYFTLPFPSPLSHLCFSDVKKICLDSGKEEE